MGFGQAWLNLELRLLSEPVTVVGLDIPSRGQSGITKYQLVPSLIQRL